MKIAVFNVLNMGMRKVNNEFVCENLIKIVSRYSVVVMLEVKDQKGEAMKTFLSKLNSDGGNRSHPYSMMCSKPLGRSSYKEKFVFFYREDEAKVVDSFQYEEEDEDVLAREPFILHFSFPNTAVQELVLIPVHSKPEDAAIELNALDDVVDAVKKRWNNKNIMILGDFNADGRYLSKKNKAESRLCSADYHWLIDDDVDTTTSNLNDHTYDRIVVHGKTLLNGVVPGSAKSFNFQTAFNLKDKDAQRISDHYPVEVELKNLQRPRAPKRKRTASPKGQKRGQQKKKNLTGARKSGPSSNTPAKRTHF
ncbi:deoxyribonuclease-1-like isoform X2 [Anoplopoma fimbria]|uniref:deoxyribonuclease-1-like isoform X2 n=1 Tax=Anoplopoma fimbria TaxID=229290 RepID=UPI0023EB3ED6|nr:deoxyribonuclease-1-like isoform X2 [Anoplopoma fimbria]